MWDRAPAAIPVKSFTGTVLVRNRIIRAVPLCGGLGELVRVYLSMALGPLASALPTAFPRPTSSLPLSSVPSLSPLRLTQGGVTAAQTITRIQQQGCGPGITQPGAGGISHRMGLRVRRIWEKDLLCRDPSRQVVCWI